MELPSLIAISRFASALGIHPARFLGGEMGEKDLPVYRRLWGAISALPVQKAAYLCGIFETAVTLLEAQVDEPKRGRPRSPRKDVKKHLQAAEARSEFK